MVAMNPSKMTLEAMRAALPTLFAPYVLELGLELQAVHEGEVQLALPIAAKHVHAGGVMCGQTMMSAADTAMVLAVMTQLGEFRPMTTVQLQTSFLRPIPAPKAADGSDATARVVARVLRMGRQLVFGEIEVLDAGGRLSAHATTTYALL
jgi:uncharacterized protein (TIGR00369 family)